MNLSFPFKIEPISWSLWTFLVLVPILFASSINTQLATSITNTSNTNNKPTLRDNNLLNIQHANNSYKIQLGQESTSRVAEVYAKNITKPMHQLVPQNQTIQGRLNSNQQLATHNSSLVSVRIRWRQLERSVADSLVKSASQLRAALGELDLGKLAISSQCKTALSDLTEAIGEQRLWASQMTDSSARLPSGILEGTLTELGNFDECLAIRQQPEGGGRDAIRGQYCSLVIRPPLVKRPRLHTVCQRLPALAANQSSKALRLLSTNANHFYYVGLRLGVCTPNKCSSADLQTLLAAHLSKYELIGQVKSCQMSASDAPDERQYFQQLDSSQQCILSSFVLLLVLVVIGTFLDKDTSDRKSLEVSSKSLWVSDKNSKASEQQLARGLTPGSHTMESTTLGSAYETSDSSVCPRTGQPVRRWQYQIYHGHDRNSPSGSSPSIEAQENPLAECNAKPIGVRPVTDCALAKDDWIFTNTQIMTDEMAEKRPFVKGVDNSNDTDESWIAHMKTIEPDLICVHDTDTRCQHQEVNSVPTKDKEQAGLIISLVCCFSLRKNLKALGRYDSSNSCAGKTNKMSDIKVIHGFRTFTMIWIIFGHSIGLVIPEMMNNLFSLAHNSCSSRILQATLNATLAVNTFFMISGLVTVISFARKCESLIIMNETSAQGNKRRQSNSTLDLEVSSVESLSAISSLSSSASSNRCISGHCRRSRVANCQHVRRKLAGLNNILSASPSLNKRVDHKTRVERQTRNLPADYNPLTWILMRYLRLTPAYAAIIGVTFLLPTMGSGPFWLETVAPMAQNCKQNWHLNLLYVNNLVNTDKLCLIHSWYLSNDWQFFGISTILFALFYKSRKVTLAAILILIIASSTATFTSTVVNEFPPTIVTTSPAIAERWTFIHSLYYKPWPHLPSYLVGLLVGYLIVTKDKRKDMSSPWIYFSWTLSICIALALLNSIYPWNMGLPVDPMITGLHSATFRTIWAICCAWSIYGLVIKPKNLMARFLSWHGFQVSSRLTYSVYLVHTLVIYYHFGSLRERMDSSPYGHFNRFAAVLVISYLLSLLLTLLVESPSIQIQQLVVRYLIKRNRKTERSESTCKISNSEGSESWVAFNAFGGKPQVDTSQKQQVSRECKIPKTSRDSIPAIKDDPTIEQSFASSEHQEQRPFGVQLAPDSLQTPGDNSGAVDPEFQRKLAQAISRGFKLRSKLVNQRTLKPKPPVAKRPSSIQIDSRDIRDHKAETIVVEAAPRMLTEKVDSQRRNSEMSTFGPTTCKNNIREGQLVRTSSSHDSIAGNCIAGTKEVRTLGDLLGHEIDLNELIRLKQVAISSRSQKGQI